MVESKYSQHLRDAGTVVSDPTLAGAFRSAANGQDIGPQVDAGSRAPAVNQHAMAVDLQKGAKNENMGG